MSNGSFLTLLSTNLVQSSELDPSIVSCLVVWGVTEDAVVANGEMSTSRFYPDWIFHSGTCLEDGNEPTHMANDESWLLDSLEECCERYFSWDTNACMNVKGSGLWYADVFNNVCVTDCELGDGNTCGGLANVFSDNLYANPRKCCETELAWQFVEFCEAESFKSACYGGSGLYYRGDSVGVNVCVKDCEPASGDRTCGGLVEESWVVLHDTAEDCCSHEYSWIDNELCATRTTHSTLNKYWADKTNGKCEDDSVNPTTDLSVAIYDSIESCCSEGLSWLSKTACFAASGGSLTGLGTNKFYIDFINQQCAKDCVGAAPCGGLAQQWNILFDTEDDCCSQLSWIPKKDCTKKA
jgi:hypothetical protein